MLKTLSRSHRFALPLCLLATAMNSCTQTGEPAKGPEIQSGLKENEPVLRSPAAAAAR